MRDHEFALAFVGLAILTLLAAGGANVANFAALLLALPVATSAIYFVLRTLPGNADG
jgi:hypothetical protein